MKRCASCTLQSGIGPPCETVQDLLGEVIDLVLHLERRGGLRRLVEALRLERFDAAQPWECRALEASPRTGIPSDEEEQP